MLYPWIFSVFILLTSSLWAGPETITQTVEHLTDILSQKKFQTTKEEALALAKLEQKNVVNTCSTDIKSHPSCQGFADSLLPKSYKQKGWKTLLEIKYRSLEASKPASVGNANYWPRLIETYRLLTNDQRLNRSDERDLTEQELNEQVLRVNRWYSENRFEIDPFTVKSALIIEQLQDEKSYQQLSTLAEKNEAMLKKISHYTKNMSDDDYLKFITTMAGAVEYNTERSQFKQTNDAALGTASTFEQVTNTKNGICGDIHAMVAKLGESRGWEAITVGYALAGSQHVVTAMTNPKDPGQMMIVNYGTYELKDMNDGSWVSPTPSQDMKESGIQLRIFKNDKTGDLLGKMQQIATIPTSLGSFMNELFKRNGQISKGMLQNNNYVVKKIDAENTGRHKVEIEDDGNKISERVAGEGIVVYEGQTDGNHIYGVAVSENVYETIYVWDDEEKKCVQAKNKYFSVGLAGSLVVSEHPADTNQFFVYLNMKGGKIFHVYQSDHFLFKGVIGYEMEGFLSPSSEGISADVNFTTLMGVVADFNKNGTTIHTSLTYESNPGYKDQNLWTDLKKMKTNVNPLSFNAVSLDANLAQKLNNRMTLVSNNNFTLTRVGARVLFSTGIVQGNTTVMASYEEGVRPLKIGNTLQHMNLLKNLNNDGFKLSLTQKFGKPNRSISGSLSAYGGINTTTPKVMPSAGTTLKLNLGKGKSSGR